MRLAALALALAASLPARALAQAPAPPPEGAPPAQAPPAEAPPAEVPPAAPAPADAAPPGVAEPLPEGDTIEITVIGSQSNALKEVPGSGTVVTKKDIERAQPRDVGEMLRRVPGITARQERDGGNRLDIGVRGFDAPRGRRVLLLEDGIPLALNPYGEPDLYYGPPVERVRAIEVVKGSGSVLFGPQTLGAVVNFMTLTPPPRRQLTLAVEGGAPAYGKVLGSYGDTVGDGDARYVAQIFHERGDGFRDQPFQATDVLGKVAFTTGAFGEATLKVSLHDESAYSTQAGLTRDMFAADPRRPTLGPYDHMHIRKYDAALVHELSLAETTTLRTAVFAYTTSRIWRSQDYTRNPNAGGRYHRIVGDPRIPNGALYFEYTTTIPDRTYEVAGVEPRLEHAFTTAGLEHTLTAGARFLGETAHRQQRKGESPTSFAGSVSSDESSFTWAVAAYAQDKIAATDYLVLTPGVRFEHATFQRRIARAFQNGEVRDVSIEGSSDMNELLPGIGMVAGTEDNHAFGGLHVGFAPPRVATAIDESGIDAQLDAERSINYELGARLLPLRWLRVDVAGFLSNYVNQVIPSTGSGRGPELKNAGQTRHYGVETSSSLGLGDALDLGFSLDVGARYTLSHALFVGGLRDGNFLPYAPLHTGSATLDFEHPAGPGAQIAVGYVGEMFTDEPNTIEEDAAGRVGIMDARVTIDVGARYRHAKTGLTANVSVKNLMDDPYVSSRRPDGIFPAGFRQITFGLRWEFAPGGEPDAM